MAVTKPKPAAKAPAPAAKAKAAPAKAKAAKADPAAATPKTKAEKPITLLPVGTFAVFTGYATELPPEDQAFKKDDLIYIVSVEEGDAPKYAAIKAEDVAEFIDGGSDLDTAEGGELNPSEVRELKGTALERAQDQYMPVAVIGHLSDLLSEHDDDPIEVAKALQSEIDEGYFWLGGAIAIALQKGSYLKENGGEYEGDDAFNEFCQTVFGFKGSKGRALARMYLTYSKIEGFDPETLRGIGWSKVSIAERFVTSENVNEVLQIASNTTQRELGMTLREKYETAEGSTPSGRAATRGPTVVKKTMTFRLEEAAAETVEMALKFGMQQTGITNPEEMLERICTEWAQEHIETKSHKDKVAAKSKAAAKARATASGEAAPKAAPKAAPTKKAA